MNLVELVIPQKITAGRIGSEVIYTPCADCNEPEPVIFGGWMDSAGHWAITTEGPRGPRDAVYCEECLAAHLPA